MLVLRLDTIQKTNKETYKKYMQSLIKNSSIAIVIITTFGVLMHDIHLDKAAAVVSLPAYIASTGALEKSLSPHFHTHVERASIPRATSSLPNVQPPRDDSRRYMQNKKLFLSGGDAMSYWPSV